jgi:hypothetical protein
MAMLKYNASSTLACFTQVKLEYQNDVSRQFKHNHTSALNKDAHLGSDP